MPPYLAGRESEKQEFSKLLGQSTILENMVLTGLRGVGKTVLLDVFKPIAQTNGWFWVGADLSESASLNEDNISTRLLTDLSVLTSSIVINKTEHRSIGFTADNETEDHKLNYQTLKQLYEQTPGLPGDKLKHVLEFTWSILKNTQGFKGIIFAYDEAQNLADHTDRDQFPLSLILDTFQSIQKKGVPFMLALTGLPTLFPKLVESRTYAERMFRVLFLDKLEKDDVKEAIKKPLEHYTLGLTDESINQIVDLSGGYPYFIQFICREVYDLFIQQMVSAITPSVPTSEIVQKLDSDFFAGRWARATDRQRELLAVVAELEGCDTEFSVQEVVSKSKEFLEKPFSSSHINQMLLTLSGSGLVYKNRHGKYSFAVPLLGNFIKRQDIQGVI
ncbi:MAG: ATP-binding protein [Gammaproteobacteria bacterium]|nr:ATP-binding protein [Gammaproteobacteria bacterium]